mgnify:CR=1 FL=1
MFAITIIEKPYLNLIITDSDNIDWVTKSIIDISKLKDMRFKKCQQIMVIDRDKNDIKKIQAQDIDMKMHQIVFGSKRWIPIHKI